jgi:hypothetical protein
MTPPGATRRAAAARCDARAVYAAAFFSVNCFLQIVDKIPRRA